MTNKTTELDVRDFRRALGQFPTGVTIITTKDDKGEPIGVTASSFNTVSIDPPLVLWSVDKGAYSADIMTNTEHFAVNVLGKTQVDMSNRFAGRGEDKFAGVSYTESEHGSPLFEGCAAQFECKTWNVYEGGDHLIIVGEVLNYRHSEGVAPLVFACGSYAVSMQHPSSIPNEAIKVPGNGFLGDYMLYLLRMAYTRCSAQLYPELMEKHGIPPEEWRVLTLLGDSGEEAAEQMAGLIGQPMNVFNATMDRMAGKGYVVVPGDGNVQLTEEGKEVAESLFKIAKAQEEVMLSELSQQQRVELKSGLQQIVEASA